MLSICVSMKQACGHLSDIPTEMTQTYRNCVSNVVSTRHLYNLLKQNLEISPYSFNSVPQLHG